MRIVLEPLPAAVFLFVVLCWLAFVAAFALRGRPPADEPQAERRSDPSSRVGIALQGVAYALVWAAHRQWFTPFAPVGAAGEAALAVLTAALAVGSAWFVVAAAKELGKEWSLTARVLGEHRLVTGGPYRFVRHPIYTGMLGMLLATALAVGHWLALPFAVFVYTLGTLIRVRAEERLLRETFGPRFEDYARRVAAFVPGLL
jgi:protein-S-isoprenylcysteine O-methyltransferase Ste14